MKRLLENLDYQQGYNKTLQALKGGTYLSLEQMWLDYIPDIPEWTSKDLFLQGAMAAYYNFKS